ncbi:MAG: ferritin family protein [Phycisphaerae bacterium]
MNIDRGLTSCGSAEGRPNRNIWGLRDLGLGGKMADLNEQITYWGIKKGGEEFMTKFGSVEEILEFAIAREIESNLFYVKLAETVKNPELIKILKCLANEEEEHKKKLEAVKTGEAAIGQEKVRNLHIADYLLDIEPHPDMDYTELFVVAMKKEDLSYQLYANLAAISLKKELRDTFLKLAQEEAGHKSRLEEKYDMVKSEGKKGGNTCF